jgi:hypothetical protein
MYSSEEMEWIFQESVNRTLELIKEQLAQIAVKKLRVQVRIRVRNVDKYLH